MAGLPRACSIGRLPRPMPNHASVMSMDSRDASIPPTSPPRAEDRRRWSSRRWPEVGRLAPKHARAAARSTTWSRAGRWRSWPGRRGAELLAAARRWTGGLSRRASWRSEDPDGPIFLAGHQPELFHPGVWFKNFALGTLARRHGAAAVNLVIDSDTVKSTSLADARRHAAGAADRGDPLGRARAARALRGAADRRPADASRISAARAAAADRSRWWAIR